MALKRDTLYPGRFTAGDTAHPQGAFKNRSTPTSQDGSYLEAQWANDWDGFFARILNVAGIAPNGVADTGTSSQLYDALLAAMPGRMRSAPIIFNSSGTYTPSAGTKLIKVIVTGGGGGGGGAAGTTTGNTISGGGGGAGGTSIFVGPVTQSSYAIIVGNGGTAGTASNGGNPGGASSFGGTVFGNGGGGAGFVTSGTTSGGTAGTSSGGTLNLLGGYGSDGQNQGISGFIFPGNGGASFWGGGGRAGAGAGIAGVARGSGGGGVYDASGNSRTGGAGASGIVYIEEYS